MPNTMIRDLTQSILERYIEQHRPPEEMRKQLDLAFTYDGKTVELMELRPQWNDPSKRLELPFAKITYVKSRHIWKLYWLRANGQWESYTELPEATHLQELLDCVEEDRLGCFKG